MLCWYIRTLFPSSHLSCQNSLPLCLFDFFLMWHRRLVPIFASLSTVSFSRISQCLAMQCTYECVCTIKTAGSYWYVYGNRWCRATTVRWFELLILLCKYDVVIHTRKMGVISVVGDCLEDRSIAFSSAL